MKERIGETARRGADVETNLSARLDAKGIERPYQLMCPTPDVWLRTPDFDAGLDGDLRSRLVGDLAVNRHLPRSNQRLSARAAVGETVIHQSLVEPSLHADPLAASHS